MKQKTVEVQIIGGLGNQLFCYSAGLFLAEKTSSKLVLDFSLIGKGGTDHGKSILDLNIHSDKVILTKPTNWIFLNRVNNKLMRTFKFYGSISRKLHNVYIASELGYEAEFFKLSKPMKLKGYFQSFEYPTQIYSQLKDIFILREPSNWYIEMSELIVKENPIVIHIRRGDYLNLVEEFGILSIDYYKKALEKLDGARTRPIWIFTDSPKLIESEISKLSPERSKIIEAPRSSSPAESMLLMSKANSLVISNSTFSWWAAFMSAPETRVISPSKWFKGRREPSRLIPSNWLSEDSLWEDFGSNGVLKNGD